MAHLKNTNFFAKFVLFLLLSLSPISLFCDDSLSSASSVKESPPDPAALSLNWSDHFDIADTQLLSKRIQNFNSLLQSRESDFTGHERDKENSLSMNILMHLNNLLAEKKNPNEEKPNLKPFLASYTLEQQLELKNKIKLSQIEKKYEEDEVNTLKERIAKLKKQLDSLTVLYLNGNKSQTEKFISGLELMANKTAILASQEHLKKIQIHLENQKARDVFLKRELEASLELFNFTALNVNLLENNIRQAEIELEKQQIELLNLENKVHLNTSLEPQDRYLQTQKLIHASTKRSLAWTKVVFNHLKYNFYVYFNKRFDVSNEEMLEKLDNWKINLNKTASHIEDWKKTVFREQERISQDYAKLVSQHEDKNSQTYKLNQTRRHVTLETLSSLQLLEEEVDNTYWLIDQLEKHIRKNSSFFELSWISLSDALKSTTDLFHAIFYYTLFKVGELPITLSSLLKFTFILTLSFFLSRLLRSTIIKFGNRGKNVTASTLYTLGRLAHYTALILGVLFALYFIGFDFSNLVLIASALTLGIGFGLQSFANNFICGLRILFERNLKVGDFIELQSGTYGKVTEIHVQNTIICTSDGIEIVIPNSELANQTLINYTMNNDYRRITIPFTVSSEADKELVKKAVIEAAHKMPYIAPEKHKLQPQVWLKKFDKYNLEFCLAVWVNFKAKALSDNKEADFLWEIETALREHNVPLTSSYPTILLAQQDKLIELPTV